ncbi:alanine racemase [Glaciecola siphonariae]|uniref:Alanine racemase n=1 Tax=Glaciecola siphonariae TaxID=521012 RepID=A0ABV9LW54_9ALTE
MRQSYASIDLSALMQNLRLLKGAAPHSDSLAVVKADAYGNGAVEIAKHIAPEVNMLAVAMLDEAIPLREAGINLPILVLQGPHQASELSATDAYNLHWMIHNKHQLEWLEQHQASKQNAIDNLGARLWLKFDTGMHRLGFDIDDFDTVLHNHRHLTNSSTVIATHLACADEQDRTHTDQQISRFLQGVKNAGMRLSVANSAGALAHASAQQDINRIGIALYGSSPFDTSHSTFGVNDSIGLKAVMTLTAKIIGLRTIPKGDTVGYGGTWTASKPSTIATVAIGYADGYPRHAPNGTPAICRGQRIKLVGRVSMDMLTFDVSELDDVALYDEVELWGKQLPINEIARFVGTIGYELMTRISARVPRRYTTK